MKQSRKNFIKSSALLAGGLILSPQDTFARLLSSEPKGFKTLRENFGLFFERGGTIGWYVRNDFVMVIDSQFPDSVANFLTGLRKKTSRKVDILFNTHHHIDHTSGNLILKNHVLKIVAQENCPILQKQANEGTPRESEQVYADITFGTLWKQFVGNEIIKARHYFPAHTGGDAVIQLEYLNVAHMGDLVFNKVYPFIDLEGGGNIEGWIKFLDKCIDLFTRDTLIIFGHGLNEDHLYGNKLDLAYQRDYLSALMDYVKKEISKGKSRDEILLAEAIPGFEIMTGLWDDALKMNLNAAYTELGGQ
jgi:glyoxylase-like metal-dependent hydrolase (beta-lactamase superfamily II)